jgi:spermidine/putrescine transport system substrate-binding protein
MKKLLLIIPVLLALLAGCDRRPTLYIFNWSEYIDRTLIDEFEKEHNCRIKYSTYDSNENMYTKIKSSRKSFDIVFPSGDHVNILSKEGLLEPLDRSKLPNYANLDTLLLAKARTFDPGNKYAIPYFWGVTGLAYNKSSLPDSLVATQSWSIIGSPFFNGKQKVTMLEDAREVVGAALIYNGFSPNDTSPEALKAADATLAVWDNNITQYDSESYKNEVPDGTTWLAQGYAGDVLQQMKDNPDMGFILPAEGSSMWMDSVVMLKNSQNKELAYKFINFLMDPEVAKRNAELTQYPTPNAAAYKTMDAAVINNRFIYPEPEYLQKCHMIEYIGNDVKKIDSLFEKIRLN